MGVPGIYCRKPGKCDGIVPYLQRSICTMFVCKTLFFIHIFFDCILPYLHSDSLMRLCQIQC